MTTDELNRLEMLLLGKYAYDPELPKIYRLIRLEPDIEKVNEAKWQAEAYSNRLKRDYAFFQDVVQSFLPFENIVNLLNRISNKTREILANIDNILQQRVGEETYHVLERNFIERYNEKVDKEGIDSRIDSVTDQKEFESIYVGISQLISNIEADYKILTDLLSRENIRKSPSKAAERIFEWSQRIKSQIDDLSKAFGEVDSEQHHLLPSTEARTHSASASHSDDIVPDSVGKDVVRSVLSMENTSNSLNRFSKQAEETSASTNNNEQEPSIRETYYALERNFIARYNDFAVMRKVEAEIDSVTDKEQLEAIKVKILPDILKIEEEYHALIALSNRATVRKSPTVKKVVDWSQRIKSQIDDLSKAFGEVDWEQHHLLSSTEARTHSTSASQSEGIVSDSVGKDVVRSVPFMENTSNSLNRFSKQAEETSASTNNNEQQGDGKETGIDSLTIQKQLETITVKILPLVSNIEAYYQMLMDLLKHAKIENIKTDIILMQILEWSQRIKKQIEDLLALSMATHQHTLDFRGVLTFEVMTLSVDMDIFRASLSDHYVYKPDFFPCTSFFRYRTKSNAQMQEKLQTLGAICCECTSPSVDILFCDMYISLELRRGAVLAQQQRVGKKTYKVSERNFIEQYKEQVDKERIETGINSSTNEKQLENIMVRILPLISNIEAYYQMLRIKRQIDDLSRYSVTNFLSNHIHNSLAHIPTLRLDNGSARREKSPSSDHSPPFFSTSLTLFLFSVTLFGTAIVVDNVTES
ncbi:hypothetical protein Aperf_G00000048574 [Anoplocephala perfoliata]